MRIAVNTRLLVDGKMDGIGWFTYETVSRMVAAHPEHRFYLLFDRRPGPRFRFPSNATPVVLCPQARHPLLWWMFFEVSVSMALKRYKIDLFLSPDGFIPLRSHTPSVSVIHDLNFEHSSDYLRPSHQWFMTRFFPRYARRADRIATVSEYSKQDIVRTYGVDPQKIDVVYDGAGEQYRPHSEDEKRAVRRRYTQGSHYLIFVSTILKRKNLAALLRAFDQVKTMEPDDLKLVVVGNRVWWADELKEAYDSMRHATDVVFPGHLDPLELAALVSAADALVYPSFFEGFGIPILEAMYAETAVICSSTTSMPEVGGEAALYIDPADDNSIVNAIRKIKDSSVRIGMIERGRLQRQKFSWGRTSNLLWDSMMRSIN